MLPGFIANANLQRALFHLLAHEQLTVREHAKMAMTGLLARSPFPAIEKSFLTIIAKLDKSEQSHAGKDELTWENPSSPTIFLNAYEAEGLISVCDILVNELPFSYILAWWPAFSPTFEKYLAHPASTVRQVCLLDSRLFWDLDAHISPLLSPPGNKQYISTSIFSGQ